MNCHPPQPIAGRVLPNDPDAERGLLACLFVDGIESLAAATEAGISPSTFLDPANRAIFEAIVGLLKSGHPADEATVAQELRRRGDLESVGGAPRLSEIGDAAPTTAHRTYFVEQLRAAEGCRRVIEVSTAATEAAFNHQGSPEELASALSDALGRLSAAVSGPRTIANLAEGEAAAIEAEIAGRRQRGTISTTFPALDRNAGLIAPGELVVIAARPSVGKTSLALQIALRAARQTNPVLVFSLEMQVGELLRVMAAQVSGVPGRGIERAHPDDQRKFLAAVRSIGSLQSLRIFDGDTSFDRIIARCRAERFRGPIGLVVVDYLQLIDPPRLGKDVIREQQVAAMSRGLKLLAGAIGAPVLLLAQLNRAAEAEQREPRLSDLRESGSIEQNANRVILLHHPATDSAGQPQQPGADLCEVKLLLRKHRSGPTGATVLRFHRPTQRFTEVDDR